MGEMTMNVDDEYLWRKASPWLTILVTVSHSYTVLRQISRLRSSWWCGFVQVGWPVTPLLWGLTSWSNHWHSPALSDWLPCLHLLVTSKPSVSVTGCVCRDLGWLRFSILQLRWLWLVVACLLVVGWSDVRMQLEALTDVSRVAEGRETWQQWWGTTYCCHIVIFHIHVALGGPIKLEHGLLFDYFKMIVDFEKNLSLNIPRTNALGS